MCVCVCVCVLKSLALAHTHRHLLRGISLCEQKSRYARSTLFLTQSSLIGATVSIITISVISLLLILIIISFHQTSWWFRVHRSVSGMESALFFNAGTRESPQFCHAINWIVEYVISYTARFFVHVAATIRKSLNEQFHFEKGNVCRISQERSDNVSRL